jgi:hypothetical protein
MKFTHNNQTYELILLHLAGSKLYGNSTPTSDTDIRGIFIAPKEAKLGILGSVQQIEGISVCESLIEAGLDIEKTEDCVLYELNRFVQLFADNNPNVADTGCIDYNNQNYILYINDKGKELIDNRFLFLSSKLKFTFSGYAISQLTKIRNRDKYLTQYPEVSEVLAYIKYKNSNGEIDWDWICNNFGGEVAAFVTGETPQKHTSISKVNYPTWNSFKEDSNISKLDMYRIPRLIDYCAAKDLKGKRYNLSERYDVCEGQYMTYFLHNSASFRTFSPSMLAIYTEGSGVFTPEGKLKSSEPEHIGEFVCLLSID